MSERFISIDPANKTGLATWDGGNLIEWTTVKPIGKSGAYRVYGNKAESRHQAWLDVYNGFDPQAVVIERGFGGMATAVRSQGKHIGWHECLCAAYYIPIVEVNVNEWRRVIKEDQGVSWPKESKRCKALSVKLVCELYGMTAANVTEDEADAILLGRAAMRMGLVTIRA